MKQITPKPLAFGLRLGLQEGCQVETERKAVAIIACTPSSSEVKAAVKRSAAARTRGEPKPLTLRKTLYFAVLAWVGFNLFGRFRKKYLEIPLKNYH